MTNLTDPPRMDVGKPVKTLSSHAMWGAGVGAALLFALVGYRLISRPGANLVENTVRGVAGGATQGAGTNPWSGI